MVGAGVGPPAAARRQKTMIVGTQGVVSIARTAREPRRVNESARQPPKCLPVVLEMSCRTRCPARRGVPASRETSKRPVAHVALPEQSRAVTVGAIIQCQQYPSAHGDFMPDGSESRSVPGKKDYVTMNVKNGCGR